MYEAGADAIPLPDGACDVVLCQLGLQFFPDRLAALREMRRILRPGGRLVVAVVGPMPRIFGILGEALARHVGPQLAGFVNAVFSLYDTDELHSLIGDAGLHDVTVQSRTRRCDPRSPEEFLWQYVHSTPLAPAVRQADEEGRAALARDVVTGWQPFVEDGALTYQPNIILATGRSRRSAG